MARAMRAVPNRRDWASAFLAGNALRIPRISAACSEEMPSDTVEPEDLAVMAVEVGHDHEGVGLARPQHPVEHGEGVGRPPSVDGVGQVPGGQGSGLAEERLQVGGGDGGPRPVGRGQRVEQALEPADVAAQVLGETGRGRSVEPHRSGRQVLGQPLRSGLGGPPHRRVQHPADRADGLGQRLGDGPAPSGQDEARWWAAGRRGRRPGAWRRRHATARLPAPPRSGARPGRAASCRRR